MKKMAFIFVFIFSLLALSAGGEIVAYAEIEDIALRNAQALWGEVAIGETTPYYYTDNEIVAYRFNFIKGNYFPAKETILTSLEAYKADQKNPDPIKENEFATMLVAARRDMSVILDYAEILSHEYILGTRLQNLAEKLLGRDYILEKVYYLTTANVWYCVEKEGAKRYIRVLPPEKVLNEEDFFDFAEGLNFFCEQGDYSQEWDDFASGRRELTRERILMNNHEYMPFYPWHYGCGPTAAAMLLAWFDYNSINTWDNYSLLVDYHVTEWDDYPDSLQWHHYDYKIPNTSHQLKSAMNTNSSGSTYCCDMVPGTLEVTNSYHDYSFQGHYYEGHGTTFLYNRVRDFVQDGLPLMLWVNENHFVTAVGYDPDSLMVGVHDPNCSVVTWHNRSIVDGAFGIWPGGSYGNAVNLQSPHGDLRYNATGAGEHYYGNDICEIHWLHDSPMGGANQYVTIILDTDSENHNLQYVVENAPNIGYYWWQIPNNINSAKCRIWIELYDHNGDLIGADGSFGDFQISPGGVFSRTL